MNLALGKPTQSFKDKNVFHMPRNKDNSKTGQYNNQSPSKNYKIRQQSMNNESIFSSMEDPINSNRVIKVHEEI